MGRPGRTGESSVRLRSVWTDSVPDRSTHPNHVRVGENVGVVQDVVKASFWPDEYVSPNVVAEPGSSVDQEVIRADVVVTGEAVGAIGKVKASGLPTDAAEEIDTDLLAQARLVYAIEGEKDRAVGLSADTVAPD